LWSGCVNAEAFHDFLSCPGEFQDSTCHYFPLIFHFYLTQHYITFAITRYSWPCVYHASIPWR
jgi:hypothetical protein